MYRSAAPLPADQLASWGRRHEVPPEDCERIRQMLASDRCEVDLSVAAVRNVPSFVRALPMLTSLTVRLYGDTCVLDASSLPRLCTLRIVESEVRSLLITGAESRRICPTSICSLEVVGGEALREIQLHSAAFDRLSLRDLPQLSTLDVSDSRLKYIEILHAPRLARLDASMTALSGDGLRLAGVPALTTMSVARQHLARIPATLRTARALRELDLSGNLLSTVSPNQLPRGLHSLYLSRNRLMMVPLASALRSTLRDLRIGMNEIGCLSDTIGAFGRLEVLDMRNNRLLVLAPEIGRCSQLRVLKLSSNRLSWLPDEISDLALLEKLEVDDNTLMVLPPAMHRLTRLDSLQVQHNLLSSLPERLGELPLRRLNLRGNPLILLPDVLLRRHTLDGHRAFRCLAALDLGHTRLAEVPEGLGHRCALVQLRLDGNELLSELPGDFENLRQLRWLDLRRCGFRHLPVVLKEMSHRTDVFVHRNPLNQQVRLGMPEDGPAFGRGAWASAKLPPTTLSISEEVRQWRTLAGMDMTPKQEACWSDHSSFRYSHAFARLIAALRESPEIRTYGYGTVAQTRLWQVVNGLLADMEDNPELVDGMLEAATMTTAMLADRYPQSVDRLALAARLHVLSKGGEAQGQQAVALVRESFRRECIATTATQEACEHRVDIEVALDLAYRSHLAHRWGSASFGDAVQPAADYLGVSEARGAQLSEGIEVSEAHNFAEYLVGLTVWRKFLIRWRYGNYLEVIRHFDASLVPRSDEHPGLASAASTVCELPSERDRDTVLAQRDVAVHAWVRRETQALLNNNSSQTGP